MSVILRCPGDTAMSGDTIADALRLLAVSGKEKTRKHCEEVARTCAKLARRFELDEDIARLSGILHDVSAVLRPADYLEHALREGWALDEAERRIPSLLHQRVSETAARDWFGVKDGTVLSAVGCHSTLKAGASEYDMALFLADKLSWDQEGEPPFRETVEDALRHSLARASLAYIEYALAHGLIAYPHTWLLEAGAWLSDRRRT